MRFLRVTSLFERVSTSLITIVSPNVGKKRWKRRDILSAYQYQSNENKRSANLIENYIDFNSLTNVLEVGSNSGPNIITLAKKYKDITFTGFDINASAIELGNRYASENHLDNLHFRELDITDSEVNSELTNQFFDLIFTFATLMYIHPKYIREVLTSLVQASRANLIFVEQFDSGLLSKVFKEGRLSGMETSFKRNYKTLIEEVCDSLDLPAPIVEVYDVDPSIWSPGGGNARAIKVFIERIQSNK